MEIYPEFKDNEDVLHIEIIQALRDTIEIKDPYTRGHSDRVSELSVLMGEKLRLPEEQLVTLRVGGLFHDIGKIGMTDEILSSATKLTDDEYADIKKHPVIGAYILSKSTMFKDIIPIVKYHHERYDGTGYPDKLAGEAIPYLARIAAVCDAFDAMTTKRSYRDSLPLDTVKSELNKHKGTQFDPKITDVFLDIIKYHLDEIEEIQHRHS